ncbi:hypothetical protein K7H08_03165 [Halomonas sp. IOP_6]|uniref:TRADD-N-associated membrane domain-containing protein n=1 Tax=Halomonadaceae TaxID=28256 RepID=UPI001E2BA5A6|nr:MULTISPECIES: hypothetical protein [Halomonas]MCD6003834.1 hypothetical protein [Halomonas sp. IOP_6]
MSILDQEFIGSILAGITASIAAASLYGALKAGVLRKIRLGSFEIEGNNSDVIELKRAFAEAAGSETKEVPFEIEQLANYYSQILAQSKISFWFSLIFASLGFAVIVVAAFLFQGVETGSTVAQFTAGVIMDAVAGLFFVQSRNAQKSMGDFFDKLRNDRAQAESRAICETIESPEAKDALRVHLALYYAGVGGHESIADGITENVFKKSV